MKSYRIIEISNGIWRPQIKYLILGWSDIFELPHFDLDVAQRDLNEFIKDSNFKKRVIYEVRK